MTATRPRIHSTDPACLLRWEFRRGASALTCGVDSRGDRSFDLQVLFGWCESPVLSEHFDNPVRAFERHAELTSLLRDAGWVVATHTRPGALAS